MDYILLNFSYKVSSVIMFVSWFLGGKSFLWSFFSSFIWQDNFPFDPPFVRVVSPVLSGGWVCSDLPLPNLLTLSGTWSTFVVRTVLTWILDFVGRDLLRTLICPIVDGIWTSHVSHHMLCLQLLQMCWYCALLVYKADVKSFDESLCAFRCRVDFMLCHVTTAWCSLCGLLMTGCKLLPLK